MQLSYPAVMISGQDSGTGGTETVQDALKLVSTMFSVTDDVKFHSFFGESMCIDSKLVT